ncbi:MAG: 4Fe-4S binding protein [Anaerolineae bacterium]
MSSQAAKVNARRKPRGMWARLRSIQTLRLFSQLAFALFILYLMVAHTLVGEGAENAPASPESFCPFGGLETLYSYVFQGTTFIAHTHPSNLVLLIAVIALAVVARGAFCGWICPLGAIQEWLFKLSLGLQKRVPVLGRGMKALKTRLGVTPRQRLAHPNETPWILRLDYTARYLRYAVLAWILVGTAYYGYMVFRDFDPWSALIHVAELQLTLGGVLLGVTLLASFFVERPWCRYACPLGAAVGLASKISPLRLQREGASCGGCNLCNYKCPVGLDVAKMSDVTSASCIMCLECMDTCPVSGALSLKLALPGVKATPTDTPAVSPAAK